MLDEEIVKELGKIGAGIKDDGETYGADIGYVDYKNNLKRVGGVGPAGLYRRKKDLYGYVVIGDLDDVTGATDVKKDITYSNKPLVPRKLTEKEIEWRKQALQSAIKTLSTQFNNDVDLDPENEFDFERWRNPSTSADKPKKTEDNDIKSNTKILFKEALSRFADEDIIKYSTAEKWVELYIKEKSIYMFNMRYFSTALVWIHLQFSVFKPDESLADKILKQFNDKNDLLKMLLHISKPLIGESETDVVLGPRDYASVFTYVNWLVAHSSGYYK